MRTMTVVFIFLLSGTALLALVIGAGVLDYHKSDAAGLHGKPSPYNRS